ncbi:unnamed protein product [Schistocephalus solidus]|uniref:Actin n=1 Tax=Schistocephalus solidus TaxID=70667 RepID=A0A183TB96_SCHSO|nr:unnamed protein product [Schistocephalus solidus]
MLADISDAGPVVIDTGTHRWRAGFATDELPKCVIQPSSQDIEDSAKVVDGFVREFHCENKALKYFSKHIKEVCASLNVSPHGANLLLSLPQRLSNEYRERLTEVIIEGLGAKSVFYVRQPLLAAYSSGVTKCMIVDSGYMNTGILAVNELLPMEDSERVLPLGGRDVDRYLRHLCGHSLDSYNEAALDHIKKNYCSVCPGLPIKPKASVAPKRSILMPDGQRLLLGSELEAAPELLFNPTLAGLQDLMPIDQAAIRAALALDQNISFAVLETVVLTGGNTMFPGACERMQLGIATRTVPRINKWVRYHPMGPLAVWVGGAAIALTNTYSKICIRQEDYKEVGSNIASQRWL